MKKLIIMLLLIVSSLGYARRHPAVEVRSQREYIVDMDLSAGDIGDHNSGEWGIDGSSYLEVNGYKVGWVTYEPNGPIRDGEVPIRFILSSENSKKILQGQLLNVVKGRLSIYTHRLEGSFPLEEANYTYLQDISQVLIGKDADIDIGTINSGEDLPGGPLNEKTRLLDIKFGVNNISGGYDAMFKVSISGNNPSQKVDDIQVERGKREVLGRDLLMENISGQFSDSFKLKAMYYFDFIDTSAGTIDIELYGIPGEYPNRYGSYEGRETLHITLY